MRDLTMSIYEKTCNYNDLIVLLKLRTRYFLTN